ncbi:MAG TPA: hypothetical protein VFL51_12205 [Pseudolabrys sp.]|nr:hypothetical protein [Pseudolabrys sp.]
MKFGIPWGAKEIEPQAKGATRSGGSFLNSAAHASIVPELEDDAHAAANAGSGTPRTGGMTGRVDIDKAIAEISARRTILDAEPPVMPLPAAVPAADLSALESHLRRIAEQIETLRRPAVEDAIGALRNDLKEIARRLTERASQNAESLATQPPGSGARLEQALAEIRDALRGATPAADVAALKDAIVALTQKVDLAVVQSDPVSLQRVESTIASLRDAHARLASNDTVTKLADCVHALAQKLEGSPHGATPVAIGAGTAADHLENRIVALMERFDASNSRLDHLEAVERGLADLLVHIEAVRAGKDDRAHGDYGADARRQAAASSPKLAAADVAARIAASEAALGGIKPGAESEGNERSNFILAARRAAQAAAQEPSPRAVASARVQVGPARPSKLARGMKSVLVAACVIAIVIGSLQIASRFFGFGRTSSSPPHSAQDISKPDDSTGSIAADMVEDSDDAPVLAPQRAPSSGNIAGAPAADLTSPQSMIKAPSPAEETAPPDKTASGDVTGSIPDPLAGGDPVVPAIPMLPDTQPVVRTGDLPAAIGGAGLRKAATEGNPAAAYEIGIRFAEGRGVTADLGQAAHWFEKAAMAGLAPAQFRLASLYEKGRGVKKDLARARTLYLAAAGKGNAKAMHNLAVLYAEGAEGTPDYAKAVRWFLEAAKHGVADSQYNLAILYARGLGVEKSYSDSYKWFALAADKGDHEAAKKRDQIAKRLDPQALAAAQESVKSWSAEPQPAAAVTVPHPAAWDRQKATPSTESKARSPG